MADVVYPPVIGACQVAFKVLGLRLRVEGGHNVPTSGGAVLASNHISHLDFIFAGLGARAAHRHVRFMAKQSIFSHRIAGPLMRGMHHIPVDRDAGSASFRDGLSALKNGEIVGIFPEATISRSFEPKEFKSGAERLAAVAKVPLIPVGLWGTQRLWTYDDRSTLRQRKVPVHIYVGEPIDAVANRQKAAQMLEEAVTALVHQAQRDYPDDGSGQWWQPQRLGGTAPMPNPSTPEQPHTEAPDQR